MKSGKRIFQIACWMFLITGAAHLLGHTQMAQAGPATVTDATEKQLMTLLTTYRDAGTGRTTMELLLGFSLCFSLFNFTCGGLGLWLVRRHPQTLPSMARALAVTGACAAAISLVYWFAAPTVCLGLAFVFAAIAAWRTGASEAVPP